MPKLPVSLASMTFSSWEMASRGRKIRAPAYRHEEAVGMWARSLDVMGGLVSDRNRQAVKEIHAAATRYRKRGVAGAASLHQRATELLSNQA
ncbi:hypothetical protein ACWGIU_23215 [Streptomyces sp. NPDC054840]